MARLRVLIALPTLALMASMTTCLKITDEAAYEFCELDVWQCRDLDFCYHDLTGTIPSKLGSFRYLETLYDPPALCSSCPV
ncbi:hypothetical protein CYMTET_35926 [Cymbomonas tetramitiformis]|uniref:Uncharacterized protein n=1 Tax=Cymbomonas tetramitiformis TaxID=36881 RepID=A0AAE0F8A0_9CHLO|nr:hypothetical protein CYMTET_35926 [Cymbomonas tetramitiformis]